MATLLIREVPQALDDFLKRTAEKNHRSKEKQALTLLEQAAGQHGVDWTDLLERPRRVAKGEADAIRNSGR